MIPASVGVAQPVIGPLHTDLSGKHTAATHNEVVHSIPISVHAGVSSSLAAVTTAPQPTNVVQPALSAPPTILPGAVSGTNIGQSTTSGAAASSAAACSTQTAANMSGTDAHVEIPNTTLVAGDTDMADSQPPSGAGDTLAAVDTVMAEVSPLHAAVDMPAVGNTSVASHAIDTLIAADTVMAESLPPTDASGTVVAADTVMAESVAASGMADTLLRSDMPIEGAPRPCDTADTSAGVVPTASVNAGSTAVPPAEPAVRLLAHSY